eukprot:365076-Chlamydomonas_euryale.AAC.13
MVLRWCGGRKTRCEQCGRVGARGLFTAADFAQANENQRPRSLSWNGQCRDTQVHSLFRRPQNAPDPFIKPLQRCAWPFHAPTPHVCAHTTAPVEAADSAGHARCDGGPKDRNIPLEDASCEEVHDDLVGQPMRQPLACQPGGSKAVVVEGACPQVCGAMCEQELVCRQPVSHS